MCHTQMNSDVDKGRAVTEFNLEVGTKKVAQISSILSCSHLIKNGGFPKFNMSPLQSFDGDRYEVQFARCSYLVKRIGAGSGEVADVKI